MKQDQILRNASAASLAALTLSDWFLRGTAGERAGAMREMAEALSKSPDEELARAAERLGRAFAGKTAEELEAEWTKAFALGSASVTPHESVIRTGLVMQEPRDETLKWMRRFGLLPSKEIREAQDHAGLQLALLAHLEAGRLSEDASDAAEAESAASEFISERLAWIPALYAALSEKDAPESALAPVSLLDKLLEALKNGSPVSA